jgi:hypothetical protein
MYAIVQLVVEEAMLNGATHITTFETLEEAKEVFKKDIEEEKRFANEREIEYEEDFYEDGDYMGYILKFGDYATKYQLVDLSEKFNSVTF